MKQLLTLCLALIGGLVVVGLVRAGGDAKKDSDALQGTWEWTGEGKKVRLGFTGDQFTLTFVGEGSLEGVFKLDPGKKPAAIDLTVTDGSEKDFFGKISLGIYALEKESLRWAAAHPGVKTRPTGFPQKQGENTVVHMVFKRVK